MISIKMYEKLMCITPDQQKACRYAASFDFAVWSEALRNFLGKAAEPMIALEAKEQKYHIGSHKIRLETMIRNWDLIQSIIKEELPPIDVLESLYDAVGLPKSMREIGLEEEILPMTFKAAKDIRDKYVLPRLCWDLGILDEMI
jgi:hypothetical protein